METAEQPNARTSKWGKRRDRKKKAYDKSNADSTREGTITPLPPTLDASTQTEQHRLVEYQQL